MYQCQRKYQVNFGALNKRFSFLIIYSSGRWRWCQVDNEWKYIVISSFETIVQRINTIGIKVSRNCFYSSSSKNRFKNYISYTNKELDELITGLQLKYDNKAIIILQSDHGLDDIPGSHWKDAFRNYTAYFFPDKDYTSLRDNLSNVNTFRILFNKYFGQQLPLLADSSIYNK